MLRNRFFLAAFAALLLAACSNTVATRNAPTTSTSAQSGVYQSVNTSISARNASPRTRAPKSGYVSSLNASVAAAKGLPVENGKSLVTVRSVNVTVPKSLKVSEANQYFPKGDIVWREDPVGDRYEQVRKIVSDAVTRGAAGLNGPVEIVLNVEVVKFHALSQKARYSVGGIHNLVFMISVTDAGTGEVLVEPRIWKSDLKAFGGQEAIEAEAAGQTQKVRISDHLALSIREELTQVNGHQNARLGMLQAIHKF